MICGLSLNLTRCLVGCCRCRCFRIEVGLLEGDVGVGVLTVVIDLQWLVLAVVVPSTTSLQDLHIGGVGEYCLVLGLNQCMYLS